MEIFSTWHTLHFNNILSKIKGFSDYLPLHSRHPFFDDLTEFHKTQPKFKVPDEPVTFETFSNLKAYFDPKDESFLIDILNLYKKEIMDASKQEIYKNVYAQIVFLLGNIKKIYDRHPELFIPSSELKKTHSMKQKPVIRLFKNHAVEFCLSREIRNAVRKLMAKNKSLKKWKDLIVVESEEERKNGIVYAILPSEFRKLLETLNLTSKDFLIFEYPLVDDYQSLSLPIISSYGTHCIPSMEAFCRIVHYLAVILKVFQRASCGNIRIVLLWIDHLMDSLLVEKPVFYLIEVWKIEEIFVKARGDLTPFLTEPGYEVPFQPTYNKNEIFRVFEIMLRNIQWEKQHFYKSVNMILGFMSYETITIKQLYTSYSQMVRLYLQAYRPKVKSFVINQSSRVKRYNKDSFSKANSSQPESESKTFTASSKMLVTQESSQKEKAPSCSTEIAENQVQQREEELNNEKKKLKTKTARRKTTNESSRKREELLEKVQKTKTEIEKKLKSQPNTITADSEEQIKKDREDVELSRILGFYNLKEVPEDTDSFVINQSSRVKRYINDNLSNANSSQPESESKTFTATSKMLVTQESSQKEKSCSTEKIAENQVQQREEELNNEKKKLKTTKARRKTTNESSQKREELLEKVQKTKTEIEKRLKSQPNTVTAGSEEQIKKDREDVENVEIRRVLEFYNLKQVPEDTDSFVINQSSRVKRYINDNLSNANSSQPESESKTFTATSKMLVTQESSQKEKAPSCSTAKIAENQVQQREEELNNEKKKLKTNKVHGKTSNLRQVQQKHEELLEKVKKTKTEIEKRLKSQPNTVTAGPKEQIKKVEDVEFSRVLEFYNLKEVPEDTDSVLLKDDSGRIQKTKTENEKKLKSQSSTVTAVPKEQIKKDQEGVENVELRRILGFINLKEVPKDTVSVLLKDDSGRVKNIEPENKLENCEDLKRKVEFLMRENKQLRAENSKIREHVDSAWSRLHRLCSNYPEYVYLKEAKNDIMRLRGFLGNLEE